MIHHTPATKLQIARPTFAHQIGTLNKDDPTPLYQQLQKLLRTAIHSQIITASEAIPPERDLAYDFDVSRITVRKAIDGLVSEGLLMRRQGSGTYVASRFEKSLSRLSSFSEDMISRGRKPHSEWISKTHGVVTPEESLSLGLSPGSQVCRFQRLRYADGAIMALEYTTLPAFALPTLDEVGDSLYEALTRTGNRPVRALQRLRAVALTGEQADRLQVCPGTPGLFIERRGFLADGLTCELNHSYYRGDAYDVIAEVNELGTLTYGF